jgi:hypothetical protein
MGIVIPKRWQEVLHKIQAGGFPEAVIAGGALRDLHHDMPVKDIDIFVHQCDAGTAITKDLLSKAIGYQPICTAFDRDAVAAPNDQDQDQDEYEYEDWNDDMTLIVDYQHNEPRCGVDDSLICVKDYNEPNFQIMAMDWPTAGQPWGYKVTNDFDLGFNRIYYDGKNVVMTAAYVVDCEQKTMTCLRCRNDYELERIQKRLVRLQNKYPDYQPKNVGVKS